ERDDLGAGDGADRRDAGAHRAAADDRRAGSALAEAAAELWTAEPEIVAQDVEERRRRIDVHRMSSTVDAKRDGAHRRIIGRGLCSETRMPTTAPELI